MSAFSAVVTVNFTESTGSFHGSGKSRRKAIQGPDFFVLAATTMLRQVPPFRKPIMHRQPGAEHCSILGLVLIDKNPVKNNKRSCKKMKNVNNVQTSP